MDDFQSAHSVALNTARRMVATGLDPEKVAESMIVAGLAIWGAHNDRKESAEALLRLFDYERGVA
ncbi:hypothetical protein [Ochrobactrum sp. S1502_03]|uniref:hypothetical protein n=1 Tax=Ochrobactrum sp. S1502_03 TaxID=3108451 RepID=UPI0037CB4FD6